MKLNEKGFAISTILYGLLLVGVLTMALLMNTASFNLMTTKDFVESVEADLNDTANAYLPSSDVWSSSTSKTFEPTKTGYYDVRLCSSGTCASGVIYLVFRQKLFVNFGGGASIRTNKNDSKYNIMSVGDNYISGGAYFKSGLTSASGTLNSTGKYFLNSIMKSGSGNSVSISYKSNVLNIENVPRNIPKADGHIRFIKDCANNESSRTWTEIQVLSRGKNVAYKKPTTPDLGSMNDPNFKFLTDGNVSGSSSASSKTSCVIVDIGRDMNNNNEFFPIDQIVVFASGNHTLYVSSEENAENWQVINRSDIGINNSSYYNGYIF